MTESLADPRSAAPDRSSPGVGRVVATASIITVAFMGSVVITPLYSVFQGKFGFSDITLTLVYAVYVVGNIAALLLFGQVSDQIGRKRTAFAGLAVAMLSGLAFLFAQGTAWLYAGRLLIGISVGILSGTGTAWLAEHFGRDRAPAATVTAAVANLSGIAAGPLVAGVLAQYVSHPLVVPFVTYLALVALVVAGVAVTPETRAASVSRLRQVRVHLQLGVPAESLARFAAPAVTGFVTFAMGGFYFSLVPSIVIRDLHLTNLAVGGLVVFELAAVAVAGILLGRRVRPEPAMVAGLVSLLPAVILVVTAQDTRSTWLLVVATAFAGLTMAFGYRGSLQVVNAIAPDARRAEVVSTYLIACFLGNSVPVIGVGVLTHLYGPVVASLAFAATLAVLALAALGWFRRVGARP